MMKPIPRTATRWAIALHSRGKHRGSSIFARRRRGESEPLYQPRAEARAAAAKLRCLGLCATPIRVRVTIEAKAEG